MTLPPEIEAVALLGWRLYPASNRSKAGCIKGGSLHATYDLNQLARWAREFPGCNWRVVMSGSGIWALDLDVPSTDHKADGIAELAEMVQRNGPLPNRPTTRSGGGGLALFFRHNGEPINGKTGWPAPGMDPRRGNLSVTIPPSRHIRTGRPYRWLVKPWEVSPPDAPEWLLKAVAPPPEPPKPAIPYIGTSDRARRALCRAVDDVRHAGNGTRNDTLNRRAYLVARHVAAGLLGEHEAVEALYAAARSAGLDHLEIKDTIRSAFRTGAQRPVEASWSAQ